MSRASDCQPARLWSRRVAGDTGSDWPGPATRRPGDRRRAAGRAAGPAPAICQPAGGGPRQRLLLLVPSL